VSFLPDHRSEMPCFARRQLLQRAGLGFGAVALSELLPAVSRGESTANPMAAKQPHYSARAKSVIHLFMNGGPSHLDTFDPKPALQKYAGSEIPGGNPKTERPTGAVLPSPFRFRRHGESGLPVSEIFPHLADCIDELAIIRSMHTDSFNHEPSLLMMNCGAPRVVRPSVGSWVTYGLGSENQNLPAFISMCPQGYPIKGVQNWQAGFLPGAHQGTYVDTQHEAVEKLIDNIKNRRITAGQQRRQLILLAELNRQHLQARQEDAELEARIQSFELAYRMQSDAGEAFDVSREPRHVLDMYGPGIQARQLLSYLRRV